MKQLVTQWKWTLGTLAVLALIVFATIGLTGKSDSDEDMQTAIQKSGKLVIAMSPDYAPYEFRTMINGRDTVVGSDIKLAQALADELGVQLVISATTFDNVLNSLNSGKADLAISGLSATPERAEHYRFSTPYYEATTVLLVKKDKAATYTSIASFDNQPIGAQKGTIQNTQAQEQMPQANLVALTSTSELVNELKSGKLNGIVTEYPIAAGYVAQNSDLAISSVSLKSSGDTSSNVVAMPKGKKSERLKKTIDKVIKKLVKEGKYKAYIDEASKTIAENE
ncbi:transporter substrate-binding domain-containing protein [Streptococcus sp. DD12]|uniref:transporter substrate-binding domain-containing protein n=1 Tax=Streptococcus sp. DD12 TaxID=1777880 RepID=UPI00079C8C32|nr:transporter substrate-binding domain-containing protein [Streptococcus sp. DD12]KXT76706.1 Amino acid ABC transporter, amino acid-binding/permease protein [Streptococcus sp. DD12]